MQSLRTCAPAHLPPPFRSHTFNWQPSGITWYVDGTQWDFKAAPVPSKPQVILLSIWTMNSKDFGGVLPSLDHPPYFSYFKDVVRLVCDLPEPKVRCRLQQGEGWRVNWLQAARCQCIASWMSHLPPLEVEDSARRVPCVHS